MEYLVLYRDNTGIESIMEFETEEEAEVAINNDLENCKEYCQSLNYDYGDFGNTTEFWVSQGNEYASWKRLWRD